MGRPRKSISDIHTDLVSISMTANRKQRLKADAKAAGLSVSAYVNRELFGVDSIRPVAAPRAAERLAALKAAAAALSELAVKTEVMVGPVQAIEFGISLMEIERALMLVARPGSIRQATEVPESDQDWSEEQPE